VTSIIAGWLLALTFDAAEPEPQPVAIRAIAKINALAEIKTIRLLIIGIVFMY